MAKTVIVSSVRALIASIVAELKIWSLAVSIHRCYHWVLYLTSRRRTQSLPKVWEVDFGHQVRKSFISDIGNTTPSQMCLLILRTSALRNLWNDRCSSSMHASRGIGCEQAIMEPMKLTPQKASSFAIFLTRVILAELLVAGIVSIDAWLWSLRKTVNCDAID